MIKINEIPEPTCKLYAPDNTLIGEIKSELSLFDVRLQIKNKQLKGYYLFWFGQNGNYVRIDIGEDGRLSDWPKGFYDQSNNYLMELVNWRLDNAFEK